MATLKAIQRRVGVDPDGKWGPATAAAIMAALPPPRMKRLRDAAGFFAGVRRVTGALDQVQVEILNALLATATNWSTSWLACGLATAWHEARFRPIEEIGKGRGHPYSRPGKHKGQIAYGRGLVQLTWDFNYEKADEELELGGALITDYAKALDPVIAVQILVIGMEEGWFTGKSLGDYLPADRGTVQQFTAARRIINGTDRAGMIAGYAMQFQDALIAGGWA